MRSTLLFASFLALVPVRLICLAVDLRIHMNQFVHSLYPRPPPVLLLLGLLPLFRAFLRRTVALIVSRVASRKHIRFASLPGSRPTTTDGCTRFENRDSEDNRVLANDFTAPNGNTPDSCIGLCDQKGFIRGGVEDGGLSCCTCFKRLFDVLSSTDQTWLLKGVIMWRRIPSKT